MDGSNARRVAETQNLRRPHRLRASLRLSGRTIEVINKGLSGKEAPASLMSRWRSMPERVVHRLRYSGFEAGSRMSRRGRRRSSRLVKICWSFVSGMQNHSVIPATSFDAWGWNNMMRHLPDHGLPLIQLKEQRRDLVVALQNRNGPVSGWELMQIAAVQQAISAFEDVISDLDAEMEAAA
jgi:hypothetical protein